MKIFAYKYYRCHACKNRICIVASEMTRTKETKIRKACPIGSKKKSFKVLGTKISRNTELGMDIFD